MRKLIIFYIAFLSFIQIQTASANSIRLKSIVNSDEELYVKATTDATYELTSVEPSGDGSSESAPAKVYVPIKSDIAGIDSADYFLYKAKDQAKEYVFNLGDATHRIQYPLYVTVSATDKYLYAAVKDTDGYKVAKRYSAAPLKNITNVEMDFPLSPFEICAQITTGTTCNNFKTGTTVYDTKNILVHFFLSDDENIVMGSTLTPGTGGLYFDTYFSNRIYPNLVITIKDVKKGDKRGIVSYKGSENIINPLSIRAIDRGTSTTSDPIGTIGAATIVSEEYKYAQESYVTIRDLENGQVYDFSIGFVDLFNYTSKLSPTFEVAPIEIEELLKKEACFLLTAGFGEEHFVIDYFRGFRDNVLSHFYLGRVFITTYYDLAPRYAIEIYNHESIRLSIRVLAYVAYFVFNNVFLIIGLSIIGASVFFAQKKLKKNRI